MIALGLVAAAGYVRLIETARLRQVAGVKAGPGIDVGWVVDAALPLAEVGT